MLNSLNNLITKNIKIIIFFRMSKEIKNHKGNFKNLKFQRFIYVYD